MIYCARVKDSTNVHRAESIGQKASIGQRQAGATPASQPAVYGFATPAIGSLHHYH